MRRYFFGAVLVIAAMMLCGCDKPDPTAVPAVAPTEQPAAPLVDLAEGEILKIYINPFEGIWNLEGAYGSFVGSGASGADVFVTEALDVSKEDEWEWELFCSFGEGATQPPSFWVDETDGNDEIGEGTPISPFKTLNHAIDTGYIKFDEDVFEVFVLNEYGEWIYHGTYSNAQPIPPMGGNGR